MCSPRSKPSERGLQPATQGTGAPRAARGPAAREGPPPHTPPEAAPLFWALATASCAEMASALCVACSSRTLPSIVSQIYRAGEGGKGGKGGRSWLIWLLCAFALASCARSAELQGGGGGARVLDSGGARGGAPTLRTNRRAAAATHLLQGQDGEGLFHNHANLLDACKRRGSSINQLNDQSINRSISPLVSQSVSRHSLIHPTKQSVDKPGQSINQLMSQSING